MKKYLYLLILLLFAGPHIIAQTTANISKPEPLNTEYIVTEAQTETLIATQSITLKSNTWIKAGSTFIARIIPDAYIPLNFSNENYVFTRSYQKGMTSSSTIKNNSDVVESISYFDGLGRPMQSIAIKASPDVQDIVTHISYDDFGREDKSYLPFMPSVGTIASYRTGADIATNNYYAVNYPTDINSIAPNPFSQKFFEESSLNRVLKQGAPGSAWALNSGHEIKMDYEVNGANEVKLFKVTSTWDSSLGLYKTILENASGNVFYREGELYKTVIKDENWNSGNEHTTEEFKDKEDRVILKKTYGASIVNGVSVSTAHESYYIYDVYGNLTFVLSPKADGAIDDLVLNDLCYQYKYDNLNRLVEKKLPGKGWEFIVYDKLDRPILSQDANLRTSNKWFFTKYDAFNRPIYTGEYTNTVETTRAAVQGLAATTVLSESKTTAATLIAGTSAYYTNVTFPKEGINLFTITYYDNYLNFIESAEEASIISYGITPIVNAKGLVTCSRVRVLDQNPAQWVTNMLYYDSNARAIYSYSKNSFLSMVSTTKSKLDFGGKILETTSTHKKGVDAEIVIVETFKYDHVGRIVAQKQKINSQIEETIVSNTYNDLGQLTEKNVGGVQTVNYKYNIRGWLKNINDINNIGSDLFAFQINYNDAADPLKRLYNGNISHTFWKTGHTDTSLRSYSYKYDVLNRLTEATDNLGRYNENLSYDKNGNIMKLFRNGNSILNTPNYGTIDNLVYTYNGGNRLLKVEDASGNKEGFNNGNSGANIDYGYDANGNMITDANKGISTPIAYNYLNLPTLITLPGGNISYTYDAMGAKQRKIAGSITTDYAGGFQYENNKLKFFPQAEGYVSNNNGVYEYIYQYKDHLGNVRLSYNKSLNIIEENNYYPFGLEQKSHTNIVNAQGNATAQKHKYNGKELQEELGLNFYDYGARNYEPALGRWMNIDPLAEKMRRHSPYNYAFNSPIYFLDPDGMAPGDFYDEQGNKIGTDGIKDHKLYVITDKNEVKAANVATSKGLKFSKSDVKSEIELPSFAIRTRMGDAVTRSNNPNSSDSVGGLHEEGGYYGKNAKGDSVVIDANSGDAYKKGDPGLGVNPSLAGNQYDSQSVWRSKDDIEGTFHVHPKGGSGVSFVQGPSNADLKNSVTRGITKGITGNNFILGSGNNTVTIYKSINGQGQVIATFPLNKFTNLKN